MPLAFTELFGSDIFYLGVSGSRNWPDEDFVYRKLQEALAKWPTVTTIVSGGQPKGVDGFAKAFAKNQGLAYIECAPAHYYHQDDPRHRPYHVSNFLIRNTEIVRNADALISFCYGKSRGAMDTYAKAVKMLGSDYVVLYTENHLDGGSNC